MSIDLYTVRVYHDGARIGIIRVRHVERRTHECPQIPGLPVMVGIDVAPETDTYVITPQFGPRREMEANEIAAVRAWLTRVEKGEA